MATPYVGEVRMFAGNFAPASYAFCNGQVISIAQNDVLFSLIGTTYGGDGINTFQLPDLRGRVPIHMGQGPGLSSYNEGQVGGSENVTLTTGQLPSHSHIATASSNVTSNANSPAGNTWSGNAFKQFATTPSPQMNAAGMGSVGGSGPHDNMLPFLTISFIIALYGFYPVRN